LKRLPVLDPEIVLCSDRETLPGPAVVRGPQAVAVQALLFADPSRIVHPALVNGAADVVVIIIIMVGGKPVSIVGFTVVNDRIVAIDAPDVGLLGARGPCTGWNRLR
jgi:hypothetical protein